MQGIIVDTCQVFSLEIYNSCMTHLRFRNFGSEQSTQQMTNDVVPVAVSAFFSPLFNISKHLHLMRIKGNSAVTLLPVWMGMELHQTAIELSLCLQGLIQPTPFIYQSFQHQQQLRKE